MKAKANPIRHQSHGSDHLPKQGDTSRAFLPVFKHCWQNYSPRACLICLMLQGPVLLFCNPAGLSRTSLTANLALYLIANSLLFLSCLVPRAITGIFVKHILILWFGSQSYSFMKLQFIWFSNPSNIGAYYSVSPDVCCQMLSFLTVGFEGLVKSKLFDVNWRESEFPNVIRGVPTYTIKFGGRRIQIKLFCVRIGILKVSPNLLNSSSVCETSRVRWKNRVVHTSCIST